MSSSPRAQMTTSFSSTSRAARACPARTSSSSDGIITVQQKKLVYWNAREGAPQAAKGLADAQSAIKEAEATKKALVEFQRLVTKDWAPEKNRVIGHVVYSPPIVVDAGPNQFTQDVAVVEMDLSKISRRPNNFPGNAIDLGFEFDPNKLSEMMHTANIENVHSFDYPVDRLLHLSGVVADEEIRNPTKTDQDGNRCIVVLKKGRTTRLTVGRANNVVSYARTYLKDTDEEQISMELAIFPYDKNSGPFSAKGDSGSVIVNGAGELYGLLTGGSGITERNRHHVRDRDRLRHGGHQTLQVPR
ncbi:uncharacterized protein LAESUDRAFT_146633 [Laetiporus sulphureus 93-53]|uniref:Uncharacterized protein n=1 Tax=Laetiporus sulphureus 93-53 TaxID=1314785 RepID=A0A165EB90_9APHY|nr:uncharacterized protein LAESUDRAFT_146633 [Laetiporus sulphureus 93-53]KZT06645.1 hypothetical protein LAESUDRAFT_146633 [Laetiporus sulphureus 93-53]